jgi:hypothetical protein
VVLIAVDGVREQEAAPEYLSIMKLLQDKGYATSARGKEQGCTVSQPYNISLPAYASVFSGKVQKDIRKNTFRGVLKNPTLFTRYRESILFSTWPNITQVMGNSSNAYIVREDEKEFNDFQLRDMYFNSPPTKLIFLHFGDADKFAHLGDWEKYVASVENAGKYIREIVEKESSLKTAFIIFNDHGRGRDENGWWKEHGPQVPESRYIWMLVALPEATFLGPCEHTSIYRIVTDYLGE